MSIDEVIVAQSVIRCALSSQNPKTLNMSWSRNYVCTSSNANLADVNTVACFAISFAMSLICELCDDAVDSACTCVVLSSFSSSFWEASLSLLPSDVSLKEIGAHVPSKMADAKPRSSEPNRGDSLHALIRSAI